MGSVGSGQSYTSFTSEDYATETKLRYGANENSAQHRFMKANSNIDEWESGLSPTERDAVRNYTGSKFRTMNNALYNVPFEEMEYDLQRRINNLSSALDKFELNRGIEVTRESSFSLFGGNSTPAAIRNYLKATNGVLQVNGFMSASVEDRGYSVGDDDLVVHYRVPASKGAGGYVDRISVNGGENEFLFNRNGVYKYDINSIRYEGNKVHINARWIGQAQEQYLPKKKK